MKATILSLILASSWSLQAAEYVVAPGNSQSGNFASIEEAVAAA